MAPPIIFIVQLLFGYFAWLLCFGLYVWPRLKTLEPAAAQRAIATLHSFRIFGLVFILPGVVGTNLPPGFASFAAYGDFATGILAMLALVTFPIRSLFWLFVVTFNVVGAADIGIDYYHAVRLNLPAMAGELGATYVIPVLYVPLLMITHCAALLLPLRFPMVRLQATAAAGTLRDRDCGRRGHRADSQLPAAAIKRGPPLGGPR